MANGKVDKAVAAHLAKQAKFMGVKSLVKDKPSPYTKPEKPSNRSMDRGR